MVYGRYGDIEKPSYLDACMDQGHTDLRFKIDNIIINRNSYRNYSLDDSQINDLKFVKELTDEEFYPMQLLIYSNYKFPHCIIDIEKQTIQSYQNCYFSYQHTYKPTRIRRNWNLKINIETI